MTAISIRYVKQRARKCAGRILRCVQGASRRNPSYEQKPLVPAPRTVGTSILYLHHSTGENVWKGGVPELLAAHNSEHGTAYSITKAAYPHWPHSWTNDPFDYWRAWVKHRGKRRFFRQETLDELCASYDVIVWKHCFTAAQIAAADAPGAKSEGDVRSALKTLPNFKAQYMALREVMRAHPDTTFVVWTVPPRAVEDTTAEEAARAEEFARWVRQEWDEPGDNIHVFDYYGLAAPGGVLRSDYAVAPNDSHPSEEFSRQAAAALVARLTAVLEGCQE
ncbi:Uncharacterised protein [Dermatophilus congolensis]|uniref:Uncharacterized protein n=1 Tax=Dermatophilus congolensis TaxID=1863 RepID=A0AA46BQF4_9MICO|nr:Uncharacterised protein [Dermatophilus congolensis]